MKTHLVRRYLAIKFQEMEEKLKKEKEEAAAEAEAERLKEAEEKYNQNEIESVSSESIEKLSDVEEAQSSSSDDTIAYNHDPVEVSTELPTSESTSTNLIPSSELPPIPKTVVEQERVEMIEINNDGASGHLTHNV